MKAINLERLTTIKGTMNHGHARFRQRYLPVQKMTGCNVYRRNQHFSSPGIADARKAVSINGCSCMSAVLGLQPAWTMYLLTAASGLVSISFSIEYQQSVAIF
jgi:hypothetical protein